MTQINTSAEQIWWVWPADLHLQSLVLFCPIMACFLQELFLSLNRYLYLPVWSSQGLWSLRNTYKKAIQFWRNMKEVTYRRVSWNYLSGLGGHTSKTCLWLPSCSTAKDYCLEIPMSAKVILKPLTLQHALSWLVCFNPQNAKQNLRCT